MPFGSLLYLRPRGNLQLRLMRSSWKSVQSFCEFFDYAVEQCEQFFMPLLHIFLKFLLPHSRLPDEIFVTIEAPGLNFNQVGDSQMKVGDSQMKAFRPFLKFDPLFPVLFLSDCQTRLALDDEINGSIQFFWCHGPSGRCAAKGRASLLQCRCRRNEKFG